MDKKRLILIIVLVIVIVVAGIFLFTDKKGASANAAAQNNSAFQDEANVEASSEAPAITTITINIVTAAVNIDADTVISEDMITTQPLTVDADAILSDYITNKYEVINKVAIGGFVQGENIVRSGIMDIPDDDCLSYSIPEGMYAVQIKVNTDTAVAGYISVGDYVDVVTSVSFYNEDEAGNLITPYDYGMNTAIVPESWQATAGKHLTGDIRLHSTIIENVQVLALGINEGGVATEAVETVEENPDADIEGEETTTTQSTGVTDYVIVAVTQDQYLSILDAARNSDITLVLNHRESQYKKVA